MQDTMKDRGLPVRTPPPVRNVATGVAAGIGAAQSAADADLQGKAIRGSSPMSSDPHRAWGRNGEPGAGVRDLG